VAGWLRGKRWPAVTNVFFWLTLATSLTGFPLPAKQILPSHVFGFITLIVLAFAYVGLYEKQLAGGWGTTYLITAAVAQYLNMFVLIFQSFLKVPALQALAPTQSEPPFAAAQGVLLVRVRGGDGAGGTAPARYRSDGVLASRVTTRSRPRQSRISNSDAPLIEPVTTVRVALIRTPAFTPSSSA
jgi:hypothetical protein